MITRIARRVQTGRGFWAKANKICFTPPDKKVQCFDATGYETGARRAVKLRKARGNWGVVGKTPKRVKPLTLTRSGAGRWGVSRTPRPTLHNQEEAEEKKTIKGRCHSPPPSHTHPLTC